MRDIVGSIHSEFRRYKKLGEGAIQQLREEELSLAGPGESNSVAVVVWHISGNLKSRFTDFLTADGEKPWRHRDEEFHQRKVSSVELMQKWNEAWTVVLDSLETLTDSDLSRTVSIRGEQQAAPCCSTPRAGAYCLSRRTDRSHRQDYPR